MPQDWKGPLKQLDEHRYEIPQSYKPEMRAPGVIYADAEMIKHIVQDFAPEQVANVATMPGIQKASMAMPDIHWGYGFPIGGVAAFDEEEGVLSPGSVGFDVNCLASTAHVITEHGYRLPIADFEDRWTRERLAYVNPTHKTGSADIGAFMRFPANQAYRVRTSYGMEIIATADHPFLTPEGMIPLKEVNRKPVAVYPFRGVDYEEPPEIDLVTEEDIRRELSWRQCSQIIPILRRKGLLPLTPRHPRFPYILKLFGFVLGDGHAGEKGPAISYYADWGDLEDIRGDVTRLGFKPSRVYARERHHRIPNASGVSVFSRVETSMKTTSRSLHLLLRLIGLPVGNKAKQDFVLPPWLFRLPLWQKRLFLASLFGAEMSRPSTMTGHGYSFYCPTFTLCKRQGFEESGQVVARQIAQLLREFDIKLNRLVDFSEPVPGSKDTTRRFKVLVANDSANLIRFFSLINFEYNGEKRFLANAAAYYLTFKEMVLRHKATASETARLMREKGANREEIYEALVGTFVKPGFLAHRLDGRAGKPRAWPPFPTFDAFVEQLRDSAGTSGVVWDRITSIEPVPVDEVYDFTVANEHHNFIADGFVVSNCGVRLIRTNLAREDVQENIQPLVDTLFQNVPSGVGSKGKVRLSHQDLREVLDRGAPWAVEQGYGWEQDPEQIEQGGSFDQANPDKVSPKAMDRGRPQLGSLGAGNHFLEVQYVDEVRNPEAAKALGLAETGQVCIMVHTGSRGCGHQIATDYIRLHQEAVRKYDIWLPDRQLACAPANSPEGQDYLQAMYAAANYAFANRQLITHWIRESFEKVLGQPAESLGMDIVYDVCHNMAKLEEHRVNGERKKVYVHRKGATRAFPPGNPEIPSEYREVGQPVLIPGSMGTSSFVLVGTERAMEETFGSTCHGAGRTMSRKAAARKWRADEVKASLSRKGIYAHSASWKGLVEEAPGAYKDVERVVEVCQGAGISDIAVKLRPFGVMKG